MAKAKKFFRGGIGVPDHSVVRFRQRCSEHPLASKGTANQIRRLIRDMARQAKEQPGTPLGNGAEVLFPASYRCKRGKLHACYLIIGPDRTRPDEAFVKTVLEPGMIMNGQVLPGYD